MEITRHQLPYAALARLHLLLSPARAGRLPEVVAEDTDPATGSETRTVSVRTGDRMEARVYTGAVLTGVGDADLQLERERVRRLRMELERYEEEVLAVLQARGRL